MNRTAPLGIALSITLLFAGMASGLAQEKEKPLKKTPIQHTSAASGEEMFNSYCAACHGKDGKGTGPAAAALKSAPPDLTTLTKRHDGKFPEDYVSSVLRHGAKAPAHGSADMPVWGPLFASVSSRDQAVVSMRISNVVRYVGSLQAK